MRHTSADWIVEADGSFSRMICTTCGWLGSTFPTLTPDAITLTHRIMEWNLHYLFANASADAEPTRQAAPNTWVHANEFGTEIPATNYTPTTYDALAYRVACRRCGAPPHHLCSRQDGTPWGWAHGRRVTDGAKLASEGEPF